MADNDNLASTLKRISMTLGVPIADLYEDKTTHQVSVVIQKMIITFLENYPEVTDSTEHQRCINFLKSEMNRLREQSSDQIT